MRATPQYTGRVKLNRIVCDVSGVPIGGLFEAGTYIKWADTYSHVFASDDTEITVNKTTVENKILAYNDMVNINNQQQYVSEDKQKILWFEEPLTGDCDHNARKFVDINEQYLVQTTESSGVHEPYLVDGEELWVLKEGVTYV